MIGRKVKGNVIKVDEGRNASQKTDRNGEKERKKRKIEVGQGKPLKPKKHEFCKRWLFVELMFELHSA